MNRGEQREANIQVNRMITSVANTASAQGRDPVAPLTRSDKAEDKPKQDTAAVKEVIEAKREKEAEEPVVDRAAAAETVAKALDMDFPKNSSLEIAVNDQDSGFVYRAVDNDTGEVIKQFPAEEVLSRLERLNRMQGLAVDGSI